MRALIYGAGVIGCYLAHVLCAAGQDVTLLARGSWEKTLKEKGLIICHSLQRTLTADHPKVISRVNGDAYDVVFAAMQHQQLVAAAPELARVNAPLVVCVGNNMSAAEVEREILTRSEGQKHVLFGFQGTGGRREEDKVVCVRLGKGSMSLGGLHGETDKAIRERMEALFAGTAYRLNWAENMDAWYRGHLALILPVAYVCYATGCDLRRSTRRQRGMILDAANEAFGLLKALGIAVSPPGEDAYYRPGVKRWAMAGMMLLMAKTVLGDLAAADHCRHAVDEMEELDSAWAAMRSRRSDIPMPAFDALRAQMPEWAALRRLYAEESAVGTNQRGEGARQDGA